MLNWFMELVDDKIEKEKKKRQKCTPPSLKELTFTPSNLEECLDWH